MNNFNEKNVIKDYEDYIYNYDNQSVVPYSDTNSSRLMSYDSFYKMKKGQYECEQARKCFMLK